MKKLFVLTLLLLGFYQNTAGQAYETAIGIRAGFASGITLKHFLDQSAAVEGIAAVFGGGVLITALYQIHNIAFDLDGLQWYYGGGAHIGSWNKYHNNYANGTVLGVDGVIGLEYIFNQAPICLGLDWKPAFNLLGNNHFSGAGGALSIRYCF